jgi:hypothetical protein
VGDLATRAEIIKLAHELGTDPEPLQFLQAAGEQDVAALRRAISKGLFAVHEPRLRRVAGLSKLLPPQLAAKIAESALGPMVCGRIAGFLDVNAAVRLAAHVSPRFLAEISSFIDPDRTAEIVRSLPDDLVLTVARHLLDAGEYITLGQFVAIVSERVATKVMAMATGEQMLQASFYADDRRRVDALVGQLSDERLVDVVQAAADLDQFDEALSLLVFLGPQVQHRLSRTLLALGPDVADGVVRAVVRLGAWAELLPVVGTLAPDVVAVLVNVATTRDPDVISGMIRQVRAQTELVDNARDLGYFALLVDAIDALDDEHRAVLGAVDDLDDPELLAWAAGQVGVGEETMRDAVAALRAGAELPPELVHALARS